MKVEADNDRVDHAPRLYGISVDSTPEIPYIPIMKSKHAFDWDDTKAASNLGKHGVPFAFATRVFLDSAMIDFDASQPGDGEVRRKAVGMIEGMLFTVVYTQRNGLTRIISARRCNAKEEKHYGPV